MSLSPSIFGTNAIKNETALRIEALRLSVETRGAGEGTESTINRANKFFNFMKDGIPAAEAPTDNA